MIQDTVTILGAGGPRGFPVARSVALACIPLRVWDRVRGRAQPLDGHGAYVAATAAEAAEGAGIVLTMIDSADELLPIMRDDVRHLARAGRPGVGPRGGPAEGAAGLRRDRLPHRPGRGGRSGVEEAAMTTLTINGAEHTLDLDPRTSLLDLLRERLRLTGAKKGCDHGQCGAWC